MESGLEKGSGISQNGIAATLTYNVAEDRVRMSVVDSTAASPGAPPEMLLTRYYIGGRYEIDSTSTTTTERFYLGGDAYSAPMVLVRTGGSGAWTAYNIGRDYLGSITHITTVGGSPVAEYSYDPWGRARNPETLVLYSPGSEPELLLGRGYTGHEYLPWFGLYNMNARLYDPLVGRFLSPDPYVQAPDFTQNFNRYSYCLNNPLKYKDEDGESILLAMAIGAALGAISGGLAAYKAGVDDWWKYAMAGGVVGMFSGAVGAGAGMAVSVATNLGGFVGGALSGAAGGAAGGLYPGVANSLLFNGPYGALTNGFISAGICVLTGGLLGGLIGGFDSVFHDGDFFSGEGYISDYFGRSKGNRIGEGMEYSNEYGKAFSKENFGDHPRGLHKLFTDGTLPSNNYVSIGDKTYKKTLWGLKETFGSCKFLNAEDGSNVYIYKSAFASKEQLYLTMGHEYLHAAFNTMTTRVPQVFRDPYQHAAVYDWAYHQALYWNFRVSYYKGKYDLFSMYRYHNPYSYIKAGFYILPVNPFIPL